MAFGIFPALNALGTATSASAGAGGGAGLFSKGGGTVSTGPTAVDTRNQVNVAPVGVNLGSIIQPYTTGSPENGGADFSAVTPQATLKVGKPATAFPAALIVGGLAVGGVLLALLVRR